MTFTAEQKSQLAKLMATENLRVEHQKIRTAKFDPKNRILYLPIWQNMTGIIYDLLCGHEVGHALYTPAEGWHDAVVDKSKPKSFKHFLNVVEDARIEKKVKRKYPGLKVSFQKAYNELMERDFFGIKGRDVNTLPFVDRLNLYTKSQYTASWITFNEEETAILRQVETLETWEDVLRVTGYVFDYSKDEQYETLLQNFDSYSLDENGDYEFSDEDGDYDDSDEPNDGQGENSDIEGEKSEEQNDENSEDSTNNVDGEDGEDGENDSEGDESTGKVNRFKDSKVSDKDTFIPECQTDESFRNNEDLLLDEQCKPYVYVSLPKINYKNIITPAKVVHNLLSEYYFKNCGESNTPRITIEESKTWVTEFKKKNERYIGLLAKEFEMRKAAKAFSKSKLSDTGDIDINKLSSYKFDDNIFRKVMLTPKGKNHGLILLLDKSGSMSGNMPGSIEQILILTMFCRKVNIPFIVYGFGDSCEAKLSDTGLNFSEYHAKLDSGDIACFSKEEKQLNFSQLYLREYLNSKMSNSEFSLAVRNMLVLKKSFEGGRYKTFYRPQSEHLSNTPLTQAVYVCGGIMKQFRKQYNLDLSSLVIVHDGDSDRTNQYVQTVEKTNHHTGETKKVSITSVFNPNYTNVIVCDPPNKFEQKLVETGQDVMLTMTLNWFKQTTGSKIFGFFLTDPSTRAIKSSIYNRYVFEDGKTFNTLHNQAKTSNQFYAFEEIKNRVVKQFKSDKFLISNVPGYNAFYLVSGGEDLTVNDESLEIEGKYTSSKLKSAFMKMNKRKVINRVLVSKFIQGIAA